jgi:hypothetical protein
VDGVISDERTTRRINDVLAIAIASTYRKHA